MISSERGWIGMSEQERAYWQRFLQTGQVEDYLRYRKSVSYTHLTLPTICSV